eukprot:15479653-Alexandrium_andersonii.AAC.1
MPKTTYAKPETTCADANAETVLVRQSRKSVRQAARAERMSANRNSDCQGKHKCQGPRAASENYKRR